jgi:hypothetical protein
MVIASFIEELAISLIRKLTQHTSLFFEFFEIFCTMLAQYFLKSFCDCFLYDAVAPSNHFSFPDNKLVIEGLVERNQIKRFL